MLTYIDLHGSRAARACLPDLGLIRFAQTETHELFKWFWNFVGEKILQEIYLENCEVEHDFSGGLSSRVILKFARRLPNFANILNPQDLWRHKDCTDIVKIHSLKFNISEFEKF